jgi:hypothetical protein
MLPGAQGLDMMALIDKLLQYLEGLPDGHVDRHEVVTLIRPDRRGVAILGLQSPHKARTVIGEGVDGVELSAEAFHDRRLERSPKAANVHLRQVICRHAFLRMPFEWNGAA